MRGCHSLLIGGGQCGGSLLVDGGAGNVRGCHSLLIGGGQCGGVTPC